MSTTEEERKKKNGKEINQSLLTLLFFFIAPRCHRLDRQRHPSAGQLPPLAAYHDAAAGTQPRRKHPVYGGGRGAQPEESGAGVEPPGRAGGRGCAGDVYAADALGVGG